MATKKFAMRRHRPASPFVILATCAFVISSAAAAEDAKPAANPATSTTKAANAAVLQELLFSDKTAFELAHRGFIAPLPQEVIKGKVGNTVWDPKEFSFIKEGEVAPDTVNPSLWRQSQLLNARRFAEP